MVPASLVSPYVTSSLPANSCWLTCANANCPSQVKNNGTAFDSTWRWLNNSDKVHAYPHFKLDSPLYPLLVEDLSTVDFTGDFSINVTSALGESPEAREEALTDENVQYNVALDMFLDANETQAMAELPTYEIMIWMSYSYRVYPVGIDTSTPDKDQFVVNGTRL